MVGILQAGLAAAPLIASLFKGGRGRGSRLKQISTLTPQQQQYQNQILSSLSQLAPEAFQNIGNILSGSPEALQAFQAPALRQFREQIIPEIGERFGASSGTHGALSSSALNQSLAAESGSLAERLAAQRAGLQNEAIGQLLQFGNFGGQQAFQTGTKTAKPGIFESSGPSAIQFLLSNLSGQGGLGFGEGASLPASSVSSLPSASGAGSGIAPPGRLPFPSFLGY